MKREWTATAYIVEENKVFLIKHKKLLKWLPPGGHIEEGETAIEAALREAKEETGYVVEPIFQENVWVNEENAVSMPRPFLTLLENIPAHNDHPAHQHMDQIFITKPIDKADEAEYAGKWFTFDELSQEEDVFEDTLKVVKEILNV